MAASDHLGIQFQNTQLPDMRQVSAHMPDGTQVGHMQWFASDKPDVADEFFAQPGEVHSISVHPDYQKQGIGTGLWNQAKSLDPGVQHSYVRSDAGRAWSAKVGD